MKKLLYIIIVTFVLTSCHQRKIERMQFLQDSILQAKIEKDSTILGFVSTMNEIQQNLDSIRGIEELVKLRTISGPELTRDARSNILDDVKVIHQLLQKNKDLVIKLQKQLNSSSNRVSGLQKTILYLNKQVKEKDAQIAQLVVELDKLQLNVAGLNKRIQKAEQEGAAKDKLIAEKNEAIKAQLTEMNTAFYVFGRMKELVENGVIEKGGGVLGVGRSAKFRKDFNPEVFTQVDIRELEEISLNAKKAQIITTHTAGSYEFVNAEGVKNLKINDAEKFWETSKYLVIVVN